ncbi:Htur_1727 family rSAM-partnered candidate RiPP [Halobellus ruber]|uniref:RSAM-partnered protein n=1 Tax=Halobellus ruber TaxID=2761102 RepID=A0A7J9SH04_9EURY|nr:Htur_1727 family rSAM-partnered candidate RiPP [Halobellus ruber]MBB6646245.1 rSAM-partnered protein [Halobellus ruber]
MTDSNVKRVDDPRGDGTPEWEVFLREEPAEPLRHVGSVSAPTASVAHEQASSLFGWAADTLWLCPAAEVARFTERDLGDAGEPEDSEAEPARSSGGGERP